MNFFQANGINYYRRDIDFIIKRFTHFRSPNICFTDV